MIYILIVLFLAASTRAALGFGEAMLAMPLLTLMLPAKTAAPLVALMGVLTAASLLAREWRHVQLRAAWSLTVFGILAVPAGVWLLRTGDDRLVKALLAVVVLGFSVWSLWRPDRFSLRSDVWAPGFGVAAGLLGGAYNTAGPPLVIFGTLRRWDPAKFRATIQTYALVGGCSVVVTHSLTGGMTAETLRTFALSAPLILAATVWGTRLTRGVPQERFVRWVHAFLIVIGCWLLIASVLDLRPPAS